MELARRERLLLQALHAAHEQRLALERTRKDRDSVPFMRGEFRVVHGRLEIHTRVAEVADAGFERDAHEHAADLLRLVLPQDQRQCRHE